MTRLYPVTLIIVFLFTINAVPQQSGKRSFIGTQMRYNDKTAYTADSLKTLIFFDNFDENTLGASWKKYGNLEYYVTDHSLRVPVRTLKRNPKAGSIVLNKPFNITDKTIYFTFDETIPSRNPELSSAVFFFPESASFDENGLPDVFIRYYKRSQVELVEVKKKDASAKLIWARNLKVKGGEHRHIVFSIDNKDISLVDAETTIFSIKNPIPELMKANAGLWVSTKGISESGGNMIFDNIILERIK